MHISESFSLFHHQINDTLKMKHQINQQGFTCNTPIKFGIHWIQIRVHLYLQCILVLGGVAQSIYASLNADPGVASSIRARSHTFVQIDREIISMAILLPSAKSFKKGCC